MDTTPTSNSPNAVLMLGKRLRRWSNIEPKVEKYTIFQGKSSCPANTKHLYTIYTTSAERIVVDSALYKVIRIICVYWVSIQA